MKNANEYSTESISLAAAIHASTTAQLKQVVFPKDSQRALFIFDAKLDLMPVVSQFWARQLPIDASTYFESLRRLKSRLYEVKNDKQ